MRTVTFEELEPGMLMETYDSAVATYSPVLVIEKRLESIAGNVKPVIKVMRGWSDPWTMFVVDETLNVLYERGTREYQELIGKILKWRRERFEDIKKDCEMLQGFLK
jgi:hypothetical protein